MTDPDWIFAKYLSVLYLSRYIFLWVKKIYSTQDNLISDNSVSSTLCPKLKKWLGTILISEFLVFYFFHKTHLVQ